MDDQERKIEEIERDIRPEITDEELQKILEEELKPNIYVVGVGGSGTNTLNRLFELGIKDAILIAMNTDARHLLKIKAHKKLLLGRKTTKGRGAGSNPQVGEEAAKESVNEIKAILKDADLVFVTCGLGGGTGTGAAHIIAEQAKNNGAVVVGVVTLPFSAEGKIRFQNALQGLEKLRKHTDTLIVIKNDKLLTVAPDLPLPVAFKVCDEVLANAVKGITELVTEAGMVNVDFADLKTVIENGGYAVIGVGESSLEKPEDRALAAVEAALNSPLLDADISPANKALINITGGENLTMMEANLIVEEVQKRINPHAHIIWGARVNQDEKKAGTTRVLVVLAGVRFMEKKPEETQVELEYLG